MIKQKIYEKTKLIISIIVLFAIIGCGEDIPPDFVTGQFMDPWEIRWIDGERFKKNFDDKKDSPFEPKFIVTANSVVFDDTGQFTLQLAFRTVEEYGVDPQRFMVAYISYTTRGSYTTQDNILTFTRQNHTHPYVDLILEPEAEWEQHSEGMTLKKLKSEFTYEIIQALERDTPPLFQTDTEYTWMVKSGTLTLSSPQHTIMLTRPYLDEY